ncbi:hypothetical protein SAMN05192529_11272 [Arachidicoccus rhizosphaerae]|uniref:Uncharacterized protein n=1 Tax=Arachidicoccus rhizosphaerae TaxID=551991 RepID=A0A1H3ZVW2_9BACT|nr:hypothetical protein [Arachidicoccus rhizosphaerae]SEA27886.1 hypothetical protein SAMN05192529_11272 [Arachidicoccus rhizosphaerae]
MNILSSLIFFLQIAGISAASGLYYQAGQQLYVVADNSPYLYHYDIGTRILHKILLDSTQGGETISDLSGRRWPGCRWFRFYRQSQKSIYIS